MSLFGGSQRPSSTSHTNTQGAFVRPHQDSTSHSHHHSSKDKDHHSSSHRDSHTRDRGRSPSSTSFFYSRPAKSSYSSTSSYKRRPRSGYINRLVQKIRHALHKLYAYVRRHPFKALMPVVMALVSSGALAGLARHMGWPLPKVLGDAIGAGRSARGGYDAWYGDSGEGEFVRRRTTRRVEEDGWMGNSAGMLKGAVKIASNFM